MQAYADAKARIFDGCDVAVVNADDDLVRAMPRARQRVLSFSLRSPDADYALADQPEPLVLRRGEPLLPLSRLRLQGRHNAANAMAALAMCEALALADAPVLAALADFGGLPHRAQWVADIDGVHYVNDSKGTNVGATIAAIDGMSGPLVLIAGGDGKNADFAPLAAACRGKVRHAVLIGRDAARLAAARALRADGRAPSVRRGHGGCRPRRARGGAARRHGAAVAGLRESRHVPRLRAARRGVHRRGQEPRAMSAATMAYARSSGRPRRLVLDPWLAGPVLALLLIGLVMVASASIGISERELGEPFYYFAAAARVRGARPGRRPRRRERPDAGLGEAVDLAAGRRIRAADPGAHAGSRSRGQRQHRAGSVSA